EPGEIAKAAPAWMQFCRSVSFSTVPAPTRHSGAWLLIARIASSAAGVRKVTSITLMPPLSKARARSGAAAASSIVTTGITRHCRRIFSIASASDIEASARDQFLDVLARRQIEIAGDRMFETGRGQAELQRLGVVHARA